MSKSKLHRIVLTLDDEDYAHLISAMECRDELGLMPDGDGNAKGRLVAEIARGWGGCLGCLQELDGHPDISERWYWPKGTLYHSDERLLS